jgi:acetyl esterase/lipase
MSATIDKAIADAQQAVRLVREHAEEWGVDPARVGMLGVSAGGGVAIGALVTAQNDARRALRSLDRYLCAGRASYLRSARRATVPRADRRMARGSARVDEQARFCAELNRKLKQTQRCDADWVLSR